MTPKRSPKEQAQHDLAIRRICRARFPRSGWQVHTNPGNTAQYALVLPNGERLYPDIMVRREGDDASSYVIEVETASTINEAEAEQWRVLASLGKQFLLFVPAGCLLRARELCHTRHIHVHGYRIYELTPFWIRIRDFGGGG